MKSRQIDRKAKQQLKATYEALNPAELQRRLSGLRQERQLRR